MKDLFYEFAFLFQSLEFFCDWMFILVLHFQSFFDDFLHITCHSWCPANVNQSPFQKKMIINLFWINDVLNVFFVFRISSAFSNFYINNASLFKLIPFVFEVEIDVLILNTVKSELK